jgi:hypothetical protein
MYYSVKIIIFNQFETSILLIHLFVEILKSKYGDEKKIKY